MQPKPVIPSFYAGKKVLITGVTGFIGKVLLWKLLQCCPLIDTIYVLIRPKREKTDKQRLEEILNFPIFNNFTNPEIFNKIVLIPGDMDKRDLNLSEPDRRKLQEDVSIVFHIAAILKMDANLKQAVAMNVEGTLTLLNICSNMRNLEVFVYVSTAYCYCDKDVTDEKVYPINENPHSIIQLVHSMDPTMLEKITPRLIEPHPNTYTYSKRLAENIVSDFYPRLPVVIARPSIVIPSFKEPFPGWIDNINGIVGIMIAVGKGVLRSLHSVPEYHADVVPVDITCNALISLAWEAADKKKHSQLPIYNICLTETEPPTWDEVLEKGLIAYRQCPFSMVLWYPSITFHRHKSIHIISTFLFQWIPAYFIDFILMLIGYKPFLVHVQKRISLGSNLLTYFSNRSWQFVTHNIIEMKNSMNSADQALFPVTLRELVDRQKFVKDSLDFARSYLVKDDPSTIPRSVKKLKILYVVHITVKIIFFAFSLWFLHESFYKIGIIRKRYF